MKDATAVEMAMLWVLNLSDGEHDLLHIAVRSGIRFQSVRQAAQLLQEAGLLKSSQ
jgi:aminopeptidase-like protein